MNTSRNMPAVLALAFKAVALGLATAAIVLTALGVATQALYITLLSIGLFCLALAAITDHPAR